MYTGDTVNADHLIPHVIDHRSMQSALLVSVLQDRSCLCFEV